MRHCSEKSKVLYKYKSPFIFLSLRFSQLGVMQWEESEGAALVRVSIGVREIDNTCSK